MSFVEFIGSSHSIKNVQFFQWNDFLLFLLSGNFTGEQLHKYKTQKTQLLDLALIEDKALISFFH